MKQEVINCSLDYRLVYYTITFIKCLTMRFVKFNELHLLEPLWQRVIIVTNWVKQNIFYSASFIAIESNC